MKKKETTEPNHRPVLPPENGEETYLPEDDLKSFFEESLSQFEKSSFDQTLSALKQEEAEEQTGKIFCDDPDTGTRDSTKEEGEADPGTQPPAPTAGKKHCAGIFGTAAATAILCFALLLGLLFYASRPVTVGLDEPVSMGMLARLPFLAPFYRTETEPASLDTSYPHDTAVPLKFFGMIDRQMTVHVCDLVPPEFSVSDMTVACGMDFLPDDCVVSCKDQTAVTFSFERVPDLSVPGEQTVTLLAEDEGGNQAREDLRLYVLSEDADLQAELGITPEQVPAILPDIIPDEAEVALSGVDFDRTGTYRIGAQTENMRYLLQMHLRDTVPPAGTAHNFSVLRGQALTPEEFVTGITDQSPVSLSFVAAPDYTKYEVQTVTVLAEDAAGNRTEYPCSLEILDVPSSVAIECGTTVDALKTELFASYRKTGAKGPGLSASFRPETLKPGDYQIPLRGKYGTRMLSLTVKDTVAPVVTTRPVTVYIGHQPEASAFFEDISDASSVTVSMKQKPDVSAARTISVPLEAVDAAGNRTSVTEQLTVIADTEPPVIHGIHTIYVKEGGTASYRASVYAVDNADGKIRVSVDASGVNTKVCGTYLVTYTAKDRAGNTAQRRARVIVSGVNQVSVDAYCDEILAYIVTPSMSERERAEAVYNWCVKNIRFSTTTSHLMGQFIPSAYSGLSTHAGNCYIYYAVASSLLTRTGIENMEIHRDDPDRPHYWNLVKIDGSWYHLDTCPQKKKHRIRAFLLTDADLAAYNRDHVEGYYSFDASLYPKTP